MRKLYGLLLAIILLCSQAQAQQLRVQQDFGIWIGLQLKKEVLKDFSIVLEQQIRTCNNSTQLDDYWAELGLGYAISDYFQLKGNFRYIHDVNKTKNTQNSLRYHADLEYRTPLAKRWKIYYRARFQQKLVDILEIRRWDRTPIVTTSRHRLKLRWKYNKHHKFYIQGELFVRSKVYQKAYIDQLRLVVGDKIKTKVGIFNGGLGYERSLQLQESFSYFFAKIVYQIKL
ncbi:MAG: DUF2490 domain-containing protein [Aureispira sp.]